jgi:hypothetical protein
MDFWNKKDFSTELSQNISSNLSTNNAC